MSEQELEIELRRAQLTRELWAHGHSIGMPTEEHQRKRNEAIAAIQRELASLPPPPGPTLTGERAGHLVIASTLGTVVVLPDEPVRDIGHHSSHDEGYPWREFAGVDD